MKKFILTISLSILLVLKVFGVTAYPYPVDYQLPDGSTITIMLKGDESVNWAMTSDGYTLIRNQAGFFEYAILDENGDLACSGVKAKNVSERDSEDILFLSGVEKDLRYSLEQVNLLIQIKDMRNSFADKIAEYEKDGGSKDFVGEVRAPLILVDFPDKPFTKTKEEFNLLMNQPNYTENGVTGSVYDFFLASSYEKLQFNVDVFGPYRMSQNISAYDGDSGGNSRNMAREAAQAAHADGCNFADYDVDNDGYVDGIHVIFAGYGQEAGAPVGQSIWSHKSAIYPPVSLGGKLVYVYSCSPEMRGNSGGEITHIGVIAHELSHVFGLPDLYDTDYTGSGGEAVDVGVWDIMASGSWNDNGRTPAYHSAWSKNYLGWVKATTISTAGNYEIPNPNGEEGLTYRINTATNNEYFLVENRQKESWDAYLPGSGMLIYHVNGNNSGWNNNCANCNPNNRGLYVKQANGGLNCTGAHNAGVPYPNEYNNAFTDSTLPNSKSWAGTNTNKAVTNITHNTEEGTITFDFMSSAVYYTIMTTENPVSAGIINGAGTYAQGTTVSLSAEDKIGYTFVSWSRDGNVVSTDREYNFAASKSETVTANFTRASYTIDVSANPEEGGTVTGNGDYIYMMSAKVVAKANAGYYFVNWTEGDKVVSTKATYSFQVTGPRSLVANFVIPNANLSDIAVDAGELTPAFSADITNYVVNVENSVTTISITGIPEALGSTVTGNVTDAPIVIGENPFEITVKSIDNNTKKYNVKVIRAAASSNANLASLTVDAGELTPAFSANITDYVVNVTDLVTTVTITGVAEDEGATVSGNVVDEPVVEGDNMFAITVTAVNNDTKTYNVKVVVTAAPVYYEINASVLGIGGTILPAGVVSVLKGENQTFAISADEGYAIKQVLIDGENNTQAVDDASYTFTAVNSDHTIVVSFEYFSIEDLSNGVKVYPNPAKNYFIIESEEIINNITIFNSTGKKVLENKNIGMKFIQIDIDGLSSGIYYLNIDGKVEKIAII